LGRADLAVKAVWSEVRMAARSPAVAGCGLADEMSRENGSYSLVTLPHHSRYAIILNAIRGGNVRITPVSPERTIDGRGQLMQGAAD